MRRRGGTLGIIGFALLIVLLLIAVSYTIGFAIGKALL